MDQLRSLEELEGTIRTALEMPDAPQQLKAEALLDLRTLFARAQRIDAACEVCHAAAVAEGRAQERASA
jgi:hypothetical protein